MFRLVAGELEGDLLTTWSHLDSPERVTKGRNIDIKMGDHEWSKS
jgi:hypothetical protein